jgi:NAD(P)-dependent dehydrogenase (short-subunit alcohol dehydrogenase family)
MTTGRRCCVITGANRGLGLEFARQLVAIGDFVVGMCRSPGSAVELGELLAVSGGMVVPLEVSDAASVLSAASAVGERLGAVDMLINAAGVEDTTGSSGPVGQLNGEALVEVYRINAVGPALVTQAFAGLLARSDRAVVLNLTSNLGSLAGVIAVGNIGYAMSKAALNMLTRKLALDLRQARTTVVAISPGWVQTDMGGPDAPFTSNDSVRAMLGLARRLTIDDTGAVLDHDQMVAAATRGGELFAPARP